jgi:hypothetical protein
MSTDTYKIMTIMDIIITSATQASTSSYENSRLSLISSVDSLFSEIDWNITKPLNSPVFWRDQTAAKGSKRLKKGAFPCKFPVSAP